MSRTEKIRAVAPFAVPALLLIVLAGSGLALGLPRRAIDRDERLVVETAVGTMSGDWRPINLRYPTAFPFALRVALQPYVWWTAAATRAPSAEYHFAKLAVDPFAYFFAGRALALVCGVICVVAVVALGSRLIGGAGGWIAGVVTAATPVFVEHARSAKVDIPLTMWTALTLLASCRAIDSRRRRDALVAALCAGMALGSKWSAAPLLLVLVLVAAASAGAHADANAAATANSRPSAAEPVAPPRRGGVAPLLARVALLWLVAAAALLATTPSLVLEPRLAIDAFRRIGGIVETPFGEFTRPGYRIYPEVLAGKSFGLGLLAAALVGVGALVRTRERAWAGVALFGAVYFVIIMASRSGYPHFALPLVPVLALAAARGTIAIARRIRVPVWCVLALLFVPTLPALAHQSVSAARNADTRLRSLAYIEHRVPPGRSVLVIGGERGTPPLLERQAPPFAGLAWLKAEERLGDERYRTARELATRMRADSGVPEYAVWRAEMSALGGALAESRPAAVVVFNRETIDLPAEIAAEYDAPVVFRPGLFCAWRPILVLCRRAA